MQSYKEEELYKVYDEYLREVFGDTVNICGYDYDTAESFKDRDTVAYYNDFLAWLDENYTSTTVCGEKEQTVTYYTLNEV